MSDYPGDSMAWAARASAAGKLHKGAARATSAANKGGDHGKARDVHEKASSAARAMAADPCTPREHRPVWEARAGVHDAAAALHGAKAGAAALKAWAGARGANDGYNRDEEGRFAPG